MNTRHNRETGADSHSARQQAVVLGVVLACGLAAALRERPTTRVGNRNETTSRPALRTASYDPVSPLDRALALGGLLFALIFALGIHVMVHAMDTTGAVVFATIAGDVMPAIIVTICFIRISILLRNGGGSKR